MDLHINDKIVHASFGVGVIKKLTKKKINGKTRHYYKIKTDKLTYWFPVKDSDSNKIRPIRSAATFSKMLSIIRKKPQKISSNYRARIKYINDEIDKCSLSANAKLIRDLNYMNFNKPLHVNEHRIFDKLKSQFVGEFSASAGIDKDEAANKLEEALLASIKNKSKK